MPKFTPKKRPPTLADKIRASKKNGSDEIEIGPKAGVVPGVENVDVASMADVGKLVSGIKYLVTDWIPYAMVTMLVAEPGVGKSAFALYGVTRAIITGADWFSGTRGPKVPGYVLWCDTEGSAAITVQRINDWKLPARQILVPFADDPLRPINLTSEENLEHIEAIIVQYKVKLVVIDSLRGSHTDDENNSRVGQVLQRLTAIAERTKAAIILIHHTRKLQVDEELTANSSRGSNAILAMVRSQIGIDKPVKDGDWCRVQMLKENLGLKPNPIGFRIHSTGIEFGIAPAKPRTETQRDKAEDWLQKNMKPGQWVSAKVLTENAEDDGFSETALRRARNNLGITKPDNVQKTKTGWAWRLPAPKGEMKTANKTPG